MTRRTSIEVYRQIEAEGLLSEMRWVIYKCLYKYGPLTQMETCKKLSSKHQDRSIMPRFAELHRQGVIDIVGEKECSVTGRNVLVWDVTDKLPKKLDKKKNLDAKEAVKLLKEVQQTVSGAFMGHDLAKKIDEFFGRKND